MNHTTNWTPSPEENKLGLTDKQSINEYEAKGIVAAELYVFSLDSNADISTQLICEIHRIAFEELYDWAGRWRACSVVVGQLIPPEPIHILQRMYQFTDNLNYMIRHAITEEEQINCLMYAHYEFICIHPFNNGNGRTGRLLMNLAALKLGYKPLELYHREGNSRKIYIAMKAADRGDLSLLIGLIRKELITF